MATGEAGAGLASGHWIRNAVRLQLNLREFDASQFMHYPRRCRQSGIDFTTMADLGDTAECRRALYELDKACSMDMPGQGEFYTFDEYREQRIESPVYDARGVVVAVSGCLWVGMAATSLRQADACAVSDMTGVLPGCRRQGIAVAMKLLAVDFARFNGMHWLRALHHPANAAAIGMNRRLGFVNYDSSVCQLGLWSPGRMRAWRLWGTPPVGSP